VTDQISVDSVKNNPDVLALRARAIQSLTLAIELFNRPHDCARSEAVLMMFHHSFEMLLKSLIVEHTGTAIDEERGYSYGFDMCLRLAEEELAILQKDHRRFLSMLDNLRDCATHYYQEISESILYIFAQGSVSLFNELIRTATGKGLLDFLPGRVLPVSAIPPQQIGRVLDDEFKKLHELLRQPDTNKQHAMAMLRPLMAFKIGGEDQHRRMTTAELEVAIENLNAADSWHMVFPEIAKIEFVSGGDGIAVGFKVVKEMSGAMPVRVIKPGEAIDAQGVIIEREINLNDKFNLGAFQLAKHLGITEPRARAMVNFYSIKQDPEFYREIPMGLSVYHRYSKKALDYLRGKLSTVEECWQKHRSSLSEKRKQV
jgi:hypothetical protein